MKECRFYDYGKCGFWGFTKRCCMQIVKPQIECFYYQPKIGKEVES